MSYTRFGPDSQVYVFEHVNGGIECCACAFAGLGRSPIFATGEECADHLVAHIAAGHRVPAGLIGAVLAREHLD